jgi:hypothetical protein
MKKSKAYKQYSLQAVQPGERGQALRFPHEFYKYFNELMICGRSAHVFALRDGLSASRSASVAIVADLAPAPLHGNT